MLARSIRHSVIGEVPAMIWYIVALPGPGAPANFVGFSEVKSNVRGEGLGRASGEESSFNA